MSRREIKMLQQLFLAAGKNMQLILVPCKRKVMQKIFFSAPKGMQFDVCDINEIKITLQKLHMKLC